MHDLPIQDTAHVCKRVKAATPRGDVERTLVVQPARKDTAAQAVDGVSSSSYTPWKKFH
jgi:hypothetical protein